MMLAVRKLLVRPPSLTLKVQRCSNGQSRNLIQISSRATPRAAASTATATATTSPNSTFRSFSSPTTTDKVADSCSLNILYSPFPPIEPGPYPPLYEFATINWKAHGGYLDDKVAIIDGSTGLQRTFADYHKTAGGIAAALKHDMGISDTHLHHHCVALYCPNHVDYLPIVLGVSLTGAKLTPINPLYTPAELETVINRSRSSILIVHETKLDEEILQLIDKNNYVEHVIVVTDDDGKENDGQGVVPTGMVNLNSIRNHDKPIHETVFDIHSGNTHRHAFLLPYSSGTTGLPKGVCLTHENIVANLLQLDDVEEMALPSDHTLISPLPFFHIYAFTVSLLYTAWKGQTLLTMSGRFDLEQFCSLVQEHGPQRAHLVPPVLVGLAKHPVVDKYDLSQLRMVISAAAPLGVETELAVRDRLGIDVKQAWGMSELSPLGTINSDYNIKPGSVGPLAPSTIGKIVDPDTMKSLEPNVPGELLIKGPQVMMGYLDDPEKTADCLSQSGWLRTGDVAYYDEDGFFFITDRLKELIKVRGFPVAPAELEALLLTHDSVADAAVIQVSDETSGEVPRAYVVLKNPDDAETTVTSDSIYEWVKERVTPYKRLDGGVVFTDAIPKSASGKILRRILRDQASAEQ